jgi:hypothetical protein
LCVHGCRLLVISMASSLLAMGGAPPSSLLATTRHEEEGGAGDASGIHAEEQTPCLRLALDIQAGGTICDLGKLLDQYMKENSIQLGPVKVKTEKPKRAPTPVSAPDSSLQGPTGDPATPTRKRVKQISKKQARIQPTLVSSGTVTVADGAMMDLEESRTIDMMDDGIEGDNTFEQKRDGADESDDDMPIEDEADAEEYRRKRTGVVEIIEQRFQRFVAGNMNSSEEEEEAGGEAEGEAEDAATAAEGPLTSDVAGEPGAKKRKKKKAKKKANKAVDYYDLDDDFIDDSDIINMIENNHEDEQTETVHKGFFASTGDLSTVPLPTPKGKGKKRGKHKSPDESAPEQSSPDTPVVVRDWSADPEIGALLQQFAAACQPSLYWENQSDAKFMKKCQQRLPEALEASLHRLDSCILRKCGGRRQSSFIEELMHLLPYKNSTITKTLNRLRYREEAKVLRAKADALLQQTETHVKRLVDRSKDPTTRSQVVMQVWATRTGLKTAPDWTALVSAFHGALAHARGKSEEEKAKDLAVALKKIKKQNNNYEGRLLGQMYDDANIPISPAAEAAICKVDWLKWDDEARISLYDAIEADTEYVETQNNYYEQLKQSEFDDYLSWQTVKKRNLQRFLDLIPPELCDMKQISKEYNKGGALKNEIARKLERQKSLPLKRRRSSGGGGGDGKKSRPPSAYILFSKVAMAKWKEKEKSLGEAGETGTPGNSHAEKMKAIGAEWRAMSVEERLPYEEEARSLKRQFDADHGGDKGDSPSLPVKRKLSDSGSLASPKVAKRSLSSNRSEKDSVAGSTDEAEPRRVSKKEFSSYHFVLKDFEITSRCDINDA